MSKKNKNKNEQPVSETEEDFELPAADESDEEVSADDTEVDSEVEEEEKAADEEVGTTPPETSAVDADFSKLSEDEPKVKEEDVDLDPTPETPLVAERVSTEPGVLTGKEAEDFRKAEQAKLNS